MSGTHGAWVLVPALGLIALTAVIPARAGDTIEPVRVSRDDEGGMQAQSPVWAPRDASSPALTYEVNDRSRRIHLRLARRDGAHWSVTEVPLVTAGSPGSFLLSDQWVDRGVAWVAPDGFLFTRTLESAPQLYYFDVAPHLVPWEPGAVEDPGVSADGRLVAAAVATSGVAELYLAEINAWSGARRLTNSPARVEHSPAWCPDGRLVYATTDRASTDLRILDPSEPDAAARTLLRGDEEVLVPSCGPFAGLRLVAAYTRQTDGSHALVVVDDQGRLVRRVQGVHVEPGRPQPPAWTPGGRFVVFVAEDADGGNPVQALDVATGRRTSIPLSTSNHLEVAVGGWGEGADRRTLLAVIAVGDEAGEDVRNHLYVADITPAVPEG
jgi:hypothetical protein